MTIPEEIEQLSASLGQAADAHHQAELLLQILDKCRTVNSSDTAVYSDRLKALAEALDDDRLRGWALLAGAGSERLLGNYDAALKLSGDALALFDRALDKMGTACALNISGTAHRGLGRYNEALKDHEQALKLSEEEGDSIGMANALNNSGIVYEKKGDYPKALHHHFESVHVCKNSGDNAGLARAYNNIGLLYKMQGDFAEALRYHQFSLQLREALGDMSGISHSYNNIGKVLEAQGDLEGALQNQLASLRIKEQTNDQLGIANSHNNIGNIYYLTGDYAAALKSYNTSIGIMDSMGHKEGVAFSLNNIGAVYEILGDYKEAAKNLHVALALSVEIGNREVIKESSLSLSTTYQSMGDFENALRYYQKYHDVERLMVGEQSQMQLNKLSFMHNLEQKEKDLEIEQLRNVELKRERDRSEALLLNILPAEVAAELKESGGSEPRMFDEVTVMFTDFVNFTAFSEKLSAREMVGELNACFSVFDQIISRYRIEKIKTMGDGFIAASGLPVAHPAHAADMMRAAIEIRDFMARRRKELGDRTLGVRIGLHSGRVVAGIVGLKKYAYDIWGDTVNTASRIEQHSIEGKINISFTTYELVKDKFACQYRGEIEAKNKGKLKMYFVN